MNDVDDGVRCHTGFFIGCIRTVNANETVVVCVPLNSLNSVLIYCS